MDSRDLDFRVIFEQVERAQGNEPPSTTMDEGPDFAELDEIRHLREIVAEMTETPRIYFSRT